MCLIQISPIPFRYHACVSFHHLMSLALFIKTPSPIHCILLFTIYSYYDANFPLWCLVANEQKLGCMIHKYINIISYHTTGFNGSQYQYIIFSTLQFHYGLNTTGRKKEHSEPMPVIVIMKKKGVIALPNLNEKLKLLGHLAQRKIGKLTNQETKYSWLILWKRNLNNLRWMVRWENSESPKRQKVSLITLQCAFSFYFFSSAISSQRQSWRRMDGCTRSSLCHANLFIYFGHSPVFLPDLIYAAILPWSTNLCVFNVFLDPAGSWIMNFDLLWLSFFIWNSMFPTGLYFMKPNNLTLVCGGHFAFGEMTVTISLACLHKLGYPSHP